MLKVCSRQKSRTQHSQFLRLLCLPFEVWKWSRFLIYLSNDCFHLNCCPHLVQQKSILSLWSLVWFSMLYKCYHICILYNIIYIVTYHDVKYLVWSSMFCFVVNPRPHVSQIHGFSPVWTWDVQIILQVCQGFFHNCEEFKEPTLLWISSWLLLTNLCSQKSQNQGLVPSGWLCFLWVRRLDWIGKPRPHRSQMKGRSPLWILKKICDWMMRYLDSRSSPSTFDGR